MALQTLQPNTFGQPAAEGPTTPAAYFPLYDPEGVKRNRAHFRREAFPELKRANSIYLTGGRWPLVGWILMRFADYSQLNPYRTDLQIQIGDLRNTALTITSLTVVQARCVTVGSPNDPNAIYLVQITDGRGVLYNPWFQYPITKQYNVLAPAYPGTGYSLSFNGGAPWTWTYMIQDIWNQASSLIGTFPGLPIAPSGTPENFIFVGTPLWEALNQILDLLGLSIGVTAFGAANPGYTINVSGAVDPVFTNLQNAFVGSLQDDYPFQDTGSGRVPGTVVVLFHRRNQFYGTEETVRNDNLQWQTTPLYSVSVTSPAPYSSSNGTAFLWDDFTVRFDVDNNPLADDVTTASTIASERVTNYINTIHRGTSGMMHQVYTGALPFVPGSQVDCVRWAYGAYLDPDGSERWGWRTEIIRGFQFKETTFSLSSLGLIGL